MFRTNREDLRSDSWEEQKDGQVFCPVACLVASYISRCRFVVCYFKRWIHPFEEELSDPYMLPSKWTGIPTSDESSVVQI